MIATGLAVQCATNANIERDRSATFTSAKLAPSWVTALGSCTLTRIRMRPNVYSQKTDTNTPDTS